MSRSVCSLTFYLATGILAASLANAQSSPVRTTDSVSPQNGSGGSQVFTFVFSSSAGYQDLYSGFHVLFTDGVSNSSGTHYCWVIFGQTGISLAPDNLNEGGWSGLTYGSNAVVSNSQCAINGAGTTASGSGNSVTLNLSVTFRVAYAGMKTIETDVNSSGYAPVGTYNVTATAPDFTISVSPSSQNVNAGQSTTYTVTATALNGFNQDLTLSFGASTSGSCCTGVSGTFSPATIAGGNGTSTLTVTAASSTATSNWTLYVTGTSPSDAHNASPVQLAVTGVAPPPPPTRTASVSPQNGSGGGQVFTFTFTDSNGYQELFDGFHVLFTDGVSNSSGAHYCWAIFGQSGISLAPDNLNEGGWSGLTYGSNAVIQNSQCAINGAGTTASGSGNSVTLNLSVTFRAAYAGMKTIETDVTSSGGYASIGTYNVTATAPDFTISVAPSSQSVNAGQSTTYTVTAAALNGFNQDIALSFNASTSGSCCTGVSGTFSPAAIAGGNGTSTLTVTTSPSDPTGDWQLYVTGTSPSATHAAAPVQLAVTGAPPPPPPTRSASVSPQNGSGGGQVFTFTFADSNGYQELFDGFHVLFTDGVSNSSGTHYCWVIFGQSGISLAPDNLNEGGWSGLTYGSNAVVQNSQCAINGAGTTASGSGDGVTLNLSVTFRAAYTGMKTIETDVTSSGGYAAIGTYNVTATAPDFTLSIAPQSQSVQAGQSVTYTVTATPSNGFNQNITLSTSAVPQGTSATFSPSVIMGGSGTSTLTMTASPSAPSSNGQVWVSGTASSVSHTAVVSLTVTGAPPPPPPTLSTDSVSPQNGSGSGQVFTFQFSDSAGYQDLLSNKYHVLINSTPSGTGSCWVFLGSTGVSLAPDDPSQPWTFVAYGSSSTAQNSLCGVSGVGTNISGSGNSLTLSLALTFTPAYDGVKNVYTDVNGSTPNYAAVTAYTVQ